MLPVKAAPGQVALNLARLPDLQAHSDVEDDQDEHGEEEEEEGAQLVHWIGLEKRREGYHIIYLS